MAGVVAPSTDTSGRGNPYRGVKELIDPNYISSEWRQQGLSLKEEDDHILALCQHGEVIARFSQTGVTPENILKVARQVIRGREN